MCRLCPGAHSFIKTTLGSRDVFWNFTYRVWQESMLPCLPFSCDSSKELHSIRLAVAEISSHQIGKTALILAAWLPALESPPNFFLVLLQLVKSSPHSTQADKKHRPWVLLKLHVVQFVVNLQLQMADLPLPRCWYSMV